MAHRDLRSASRCRLRLGWHDHAVGLPALSRLQLEISTCCGLPADFFSWPISCRARWRGAVQWQGTTNEAINAEFEQLVERSLVRGRMSSGPSYELTSAGWDASRRAI